jgi:hypothetical protein
MSCLCRHIPAAALTAAVLGLVPAHAYSQLSHNKIAFARSGAATNAFAPGERGEAAGLPPEQVRLRTWTILGAGALAVAVYGKRNWWQEGFTGDFRTVNEGWFGQNTDYGGADKLGHAFANYASTRLLTHTLQWAGNDEAAALRLAAWATFATFTAVEILDAYTTKWRFSKEDVISNAVGVGLGVLMEKEPELDRLLDFRVLYKPSDDQEGGRSFDPFGDYTGQTYLVVMKASGVPRLQHHPLLRYFELAVGYGTRGYGTGPSAQASRNVYIGVSVNLSELLAQTVFKGGGQRSRTQKAVDGFLEAVQVPGTVALTHRTL